MAAAGSSSDDVLLRVRTLPRGRDHGACGGVTRALLCAPSLSLEDVLAAVCAPLVRAEHSARVRVRVRVRRAADRPVPAACTRRAPSLVQGAPPGAWLRVRPSAHAPDAACTELGRMSAAQLARLLRDHFPPGAALEVCTVGENLDASAERGAAPAPAQQQHAPQRANGEAGTFGAVAAARIALGGEGAASHAQRGAAPACALSLASLPHALLLRVFAALPADVRLRCAEVCRGWRDALSERSLWTRLDLSKTSGVAHRVTDALLRAAAAKACGALQALHISGSRHVTHTALLAVVTANAGALRELDAGDCRYDNGHLFVQTELEALLRAAPHLQALLADMYTAHPEGAHSVLRNEGVFGPLRLGQLVLFFASDMSEAAVIELAQGVSGHTSLMQLELCNAVFEGVAALDAVVDAALACRLCAVWFDCCGLSPASAPSLARLLGSSALKELYIAGTCRLGAGQPLLDEPAAVLLASALQRNTTLEELRLFGLGLWADRVAACALLNALVAHPSVRDLVLSEDAVGAEQQAAAGLAVSALVAANTPALHNLSVSKCDLRDVGLAPLAHALRRNTHLKLLGCWGNGASEAFAREQLLPAVCARDGLLLKTSRHDDTWDSARDAEEDMVRDLCFLWAPEEEEEDG
jgi:hypothetical protein